MEKFYTGKNSEYLQLHPTWHSELSWWKVEKIEKMIKRNNRKFSSVVKVDRGLKIRSWNKVRQGISIFNKELAVRLLGGYSLMVLAK